MDEERRYVQSTHIESVQYNKEDSSLNIVFVGGDSFTYFGIPEELYNELLNSESPGKFYQNNIKGQFENEEN